MLGQFTEAVGLLGATPGNPLGLERSSEDFARRTGPGSAAAAANVAQSAAPAVVQILAPTEPAKPAPALLPAPAPAPAPAPVTVEAVSYRNDLGLTPSSSSQQLVSSVSEGSSASGASRSASADELELAPLVQPEAAPKKKGSAALWVGLGFLGAAALGGFAVALARGGK